MFHWVHAVEKVFLIEKFPIFDRQHACVMSALR